MDCTLFIPHLIPPRELGEALWRTVDAPQLKSMLARAVMTADVVGDAEAWLCQRFGIARQQDWPLAPLLAHHENLPARNGYWLNATPVHLETRRNALVLADPASLAITPEESAAFGATLTAHLRDEKITLHRPCPERWYLRCDAVQSMSTTSLAAVIGRDVRPYLPQGADYARWHRILTEIQMLLHAHPINDAREAHGLLPVNSVWLWGGGTMPPKPATPFASVYADNATVRALAQHAECNMQSDFTNMVVSGLKGESHFFSMDTLTPCMRNGDAQTWSTAVTALNRDWFIPLLSALTSRQLRTLRIISANDAGIRTFVARHSDNFKFWRKNKYLK